MKSDRLYTLGTLQATNQPPTAGVDYRGAAQGEVYVPATPQLTTLTWYTSPDGLTFYPAYDGTGVLVTSVVSSNKATAIPTPTTLQGAGLLAVQVDVAGPVTLVFANKS